MNIGILKSTEYLLSLTNHTDLDVALFLNVNMSKPLRLLNEPDSTALDIKYKQSSFLLLTTPGHPTKTSTPPFQTNAQLEPIVFW